MKFIKEKVHDVLSTLKTALNQLKVTVITKNESNNNNNTMFSLRLCAGWRENLKIIII